MGCMVDVNNTKKLFTQLLALDIRLQKEQLTHHLTTNCHLDEKNIKYYFLFLKKYFEPRTDNELYFFFGTNILRKAIATEAENIRRRTGQQFATTQHNAVNKGLAALRNAELIGRYPIDRELKYFPNLYTTAQKAAIRRRTTHNRANYQPTYFFGLSTMPLYEDQHQIGQRLGYIINKNGQADLKKLLAATNKKPLSEQNLALIISTPIPDDLTQQEIKAYQQLYLRALATIC